MSKTVLLAIETSTNACSVALLVDGRTAERHVVEARAHATIVMRLIDEVLSELDTSVAALDGIVYGRGPGSFTGVRIAISLVQGLALGAGVPVLGVSSLRTVAQQAIDAHDDACVLVLQDARMNEVYAGCYGRGDGDIAEPIIEDALLSPRALSLNEATLVVGTAPDENRDVERWLGAIGEVTYSPDHNLPRASTLLRLAGHAGAEEWGPATGAAAVYLRNDVAARPQA